MLTKDTEKRISAKEALEHKWFKNLKAGTVNRKALSGALDGLKEYRSEQTLQQAALTYIVTQLATKEDTQQLDQVFKKLDVDHDGKLSLDELLGGLQKVLPEMTEEEARELFKQADSDNSGFIDYSEWISATINKKKILSDENLKSAFKLFDRDNSGKISTSEIKKILDQGKKIDQSVWEEIIKEVDENQDGEIDFDEFCHMMQKFIE